MSSHPVGLSRSVLLNSLKPNSIVAASTASNSTERFAKRRTDSAKETALLCFKKVKGASSGPSACDICKRNLDPQIYLHTCKPCTKEAIVESDQANPTFSPIHQEKSSSKTRSYAMDFSALDQQQVDDTNIDDAEVKDESSIEDAHGEEAGNDDDYICEEESSMEYADSVEAGDEYDTFNDDGDKDEAEDDVGEGNLSNSDSPGAESIFGGSITPVNNIAPGSDVQGVMRILRFCLQN